MSKDYQTTVSNTRSQRSAEKIRKLTPEELGLPLPDDSESDTDDVSWEEMHEEAMSTMEQIDSDTNVCAVLDSENNIQTGVTVEIPSEVIHAERVAVLSILSDGELPIEKMVLYMHGEGGFCGSCRELLHEFSNGKAEVRLVGAVGGTDQHYAINELLPK
jgi:cytidine deaminase